MFLYLIPTLLFIMVRSLPMPISLLFLSLTLPFSSNAHRSHRTANAELEDRALATPSTTAAPFVPPTNQDELLNKRTSVEKASTTSGKNNIPSSTTTTTSNNSRPTTTATSTPHSNIGHTGIFGSPITEYNGSHYFYGEDEIEVNCPTDTFNFAEGVCTFEGVDCYQPTIGNDGDSEGEDSEDDDIRDSAKKY